MNALIFQQLEELSVAVYWGWGEDGLPMENFTEMIQLKKADDNTICETIID